MNRRLQNTYTALLASGATLAMALMMASPATVKPNPEEIPIQIGALSFRYVPNQAGVSNAEHAKALARSIERRADKVETLADAAALTAELATAAVLIDTAEASGESPRSANKPRHRSRQTLAMPYFSFAPRG
ncbi:hypothetical protein [Lysobacter niastensis]|uniref:Uncharacterized protein n=1 Tax=Lysobacter niastensis TaxID=380629 RepID=A0ABS0B693_9GAMM|nr:hypothetical protein [Lysobacter niastensis]MBF6024549.1 hypothetical protein [Lysobacter niastensis]